MSDPASPMGDQDQTDPAAGDAGADASQPTVLCTIMDLHDGTFQLLQGDEDDGQDAGDGAADDAGASPDDAANKGQTFDSVGSLLKGVMDLVKSAQDATGGGAQANFDAGFSGKASASPAKIPMSAKY